MNLPARSLFVPIALLLAVAMSAVRVPGAAPPEAPPEGPSEDPSALARDASRLAAVIRETHVRPFWLRSEVAFRLAEADLDRAIRSGAPDEVLLAEMLRLVATVGDGHTVIAGEDRYARFGIAPFLAEVFDDGTFVLDVPAELERSVGARILEVGGVRIEEALSRLRPFVPAATEARFRRWVGSYLHLPGLLHAIGLADSPDAIRLTLETTAGRIVRETFPRTTVSRFRALDRATFERPDMPRHREPDAPYRFEVLPGGEAMYFGYRRVTTAPRGESVWDFTNRMVRAIRSEGIRRLVLDLRDNGGGGYQYAAHLRPILASLPEIDRPGGLVVLCGKRTFSAAGELVEQLQRFTHAVLIGTPPASAVGEPGDDDDVRLPASGLTVRISRKGGGVPSHPLDRRHEIGVDVLVPDRFADLRVGRDRALEAALAWRPGNSRGEVGPDADRATKAGAEAEAERTSSPGDAGVALDAWAGRYRFDETSDLVIRRAGRRWRAELLPWLNTPLDPAGTGRMRASLPGLALRLDPSGDESSDAVRLILADGAVRTCPRRRDDTPSAWELVFQGKVEEAKEALRAEIERDPDSPALGDGALSREAIHLVTKLRAESRADDEARAAARALLETGIELHPEGAPECRYSLRFYAPR